MDNIINKILEIDYKAVTLKEKTKKMIEENEIRLKNTLEALEKSILNDARKKGKEQYERLIAEGEKEKEKIILETEEEWGYLEKIFLEGYEVLGEKLFDEIFSSS